jgi:hypothetical protein
LAALIAAGAGLALGVATALAAEPMSEATGRSGLWPPAPRLPRPVTAPDGLVDWVFGAALLVVATVAFAFHRRDGASPD